MYDILVKEFPINSQVRTEMFAIRILLVFIALFTITSIGYLALSFISGPPEHPMFLGSTFHIGCCLAFAIGDAFDEAMKLVKAPTPPEVNNATESTEE